VIAEISSYQIESSPVAPRIELDNLTPDHLSRHGTLEHYFDMHLLRQSQQQVLNGDDLT